MCQHMCLFFILEVSISVNHMVILIYLLYILVFGIVGGLHCTFIRLRVVHWIFTVFVLGAFVCIC